MNDRQRAAGPALLAVIFLALLLRLPSLEMPIDNDGGARAYHARLILEGEPLYGSHHSGHHLPGIYYTYATAMALFGETDAAIKGFLIIWTIPVIYFLYRAGLAFTGSRGTALLGALFYALLSTHVQMWGLTAETELFANLPRIMAVWLIIYLHNKEKPPAWQYAAVGFFAACSFLYKPIYLSPLGLLFFMFAWRYGYKKQGEWPWRQVAWVAAGWAALILPVLLYFVAQGLLPRLWLVFTLGRSYGAGNDLLPGVSLWMQWALRPLLPLFGLGFNNAVLLTLGLAGCLLIWLRRGRAGANRQWLTVWLLLTFIEAGLNLELFAHYYLLIAPPLSLLAAWFILKMAADASARSVWLGRLLALLLVISVLLVSGWRNGPFLQHYLRYRMGEGTLAEAVTAGWPGFGERLVRVQEVADYVRLNSEPQDRIYYWSEDVQLYFLAGRRCAIDMIWPIDVAATGPPTRIFAPQTELIILDLSQERVPPGWLQEGLRAEYQLEMEMAMQVVYRQR